MVLSVRPPTASRFPRRSAQYQPPLGGSAPTTTLTYHGSLTVSSSFTGVAFTLFVNDATYDTFTEVSDPDGVATLAGDEVSVAAPAVGQHMLEYSASASGFPSKPTLHLIVTLTVVSSYVPTFYILGF